MTDYDIKNLYNINPLSSLIEKANSICLAHHGNVVWLRGLIEFSNFCKEDCLYCGIRAANNKIVRYRLAIDEISQTINSGYLQGFRSFVLQSGEDPYYTTDMLCRFLDDLRTQYGDTIAITLSSGLRPKNDYRRMKQSGADRYLMRFETNDEKLFSYLKNGKLLKDRLQGLYDLKETGFEVGSGFMVGLPGETDGTRINNLLLCRKLELDMVGIGPFIPNPDTPLVGNPQIPLDITIRCTSLLRILLPYAHLPATTAAGSLASDGREQMLAAGANVLMPNITTKEYKKNYLLYPDKICLDEDGFQCVSCLESRVKSIGKQVKFGKGESLRILNAK